MTKETRIAEILAEWRLRWESGERCDPEEVIRSHPDLAEELRAQFAVVHSVDRAVEEAFAEAAPALRRLGPYRILRELGQGGMGTVYLAEVSGEAPGLSVGDRVAVKVLRPGLLARPGFFKRFLREAEAGRKVRHENVVRTIDADALEVEGRSAHFLVMEYVEGRTLAELLRDLGSVPEALVREIGRQLATGLTAIHAEGVVHRDLKPENAIITKDHEVRIMDLGVARLVGESVALTREGQFAGSLPYAAPEQFREAEVGPSADLYALGVVLYELATGVNPFRRGGAEAVMRAQLELVPDRAEAVNPEISAFLSDVMAALLRKDPAERFQSAEEILAVLRQGEASPWWRDREQASKRRLPRVPVRRETKLYGRESDLEALRTLLDRASAGEGQVVLLEGEAGIGKSRLVDAFLRDLDGVGTQVLYGSYPPSGGLGGLSDAILDHLGGADLEASLRPHLAVTPSLVPAFAAMLRHETIPAGAAEIAGQALHSVYCHLMRSLAGERPLVWVVEDLHFAEPDSRRILLAMARALEHRPVLLLLTARPGVPETELTHFSWLPTFRRLTLGRLSAREVVLLLQDAFRSEKLADKLGARIALKSDGVPFFVFEMIRGLREGQFITELPDGSYVETQAIERIEVPSAVRDLIVARLRGLTREDRALLDVGAVLGFEFDPELVARTLARPRVAVLQDLADVERISGVVRSAADGYRFDHHQIQEVVYEDLPDALRREYHTLLARAVASREGADPEKPETVPGETAYFLANHHLCGSEPREALAFVQPALEHLAKAYRNDAILALANRALDDERLRAGAARVRVLLEKAECLGRIGRREEQWICLEEGRPLAEEDGDALLRCSLTTARALYHMAGASWEQALEERLASRDLAREAGNRQEEARAIGGVGTMLMSLGRSDESERELRQAIDLSRELGDVDAASGFTINLGLLFYRKGRYDEARGHFERGAELARECGNRIWEGNAAGNLANLDMRLGRLEEARRGFDHCGGIMRETGFRFGEAASLLTLGRISAVIGEFEKAVEQQEETLAVMREVGHLEGECSALRELAVNLQALGRHGESLVRGKQALEIASGRDLPYEHCKAALEVGDTLFALGSTDEARVHIESSLAIARKLTLAVEEGQALTSLAFLAHQLGDPEAAEGGYQAALSVLRGTPDPESLASALLGFGLLLVSEGAHDRAREHLAESLEMGRKFPKPATGVLAACGLACLVGGDPAAALTAFEQHEARLDLPTKMQARCLLFQASGGAAHLEEAQRLLTHLREHVPEEFRETVVENVPLHRDIAAAWRARECSC